MPLGYIQPAVYGIPSNLGVLPSLNPGNNTINRVSQSRVIPVFGSHPDAIPRVPHQCDDEFNGTYIHQKWSWLNQGSATAVIYNSSMIIHPPVGSGDNMRIQLQSSPRITAACTITAKLALSSTTNTFNQGGIFFRNSGSARLLKLCITGAGSGQYQLQLQRMTSPTVASGAAVTAFNGIPPNVYLRLVYDGSGLQGWWSTATDGFSFHPTAVDPLASFLVAIDSFGVFGDSNSASTSVYASFDHFRYLDYAWAPP